MGYPREVDFICCICERKFFTDSGPHRVTYDNGEAVCRQCEELGAIDVGVSGNIECPFCGNTVELRFVKEG